MPWHETDVKLLIEFPEGNDGALAALRLLRVPVYEIQWDGRQTD